MANSLTPDDEAAQELDSHFEANVIENNVDDAGDLYVVDMEGHAEEVAADVDGVEHVSTDELGGANFDYVDGE